jgi:hypothetical protein
MCEYELKAATEAGAPEWALAAIATSMHYSGWHPGDDYMRGPARPGEYPSWSHAMVSDGWPADIIFEPGEMNRVVDFYFRWTEDHGLCLLAWVLHPRKGASRGMEVRNVRQEHLPAVYAWLRAAAAVNAACFALVPDPDDDGEQVPGTLP